jgi:Arc/MetJ family transcription regulator
MAKMAMRTTLNIDDATLATVMEETGARTKTEAVRQALQDYVRRRKIEKLIALKGKISFELDWKTLRKGWSRNFARSR